MYTPVYFAVHPPELSRLLSSGRSKRKVDQNVVLSPLQSFSSLILFYNAVNLIWVCQIVERPLSGDANTHREGWRSFIRLETAARCDWTLFFYANDFSVQFLCFQSYLFLEVVLGGGVQRYYRSLFCTRCRRRCEGKRDMEPLSQGLWSVSFIKYAATAGTAVHTGHVCWLCPPCKFICHVLGASRGEDAQFVAPCGISPYDRANSCSNLEMKFWGQNRE